MRLTRNNVHNDQGTVPGIYKYLHVEATSLITFGAIFVYEDTWTKTAILLLL